MIMLSMVRDTFVDYMIGTFTHMWLHGVTGGVEIQCIGQLQGLLGCY